MRALMAIGVFLAALALDFAAARYQRALAERRAHAAARWSVLMCCLSSLGVLAFVDDQAMLVAECAGLYTGTIIAIS